MTKIFTKISLLCIGLLLCIGNAWAATEVTHYISGNNLYYVFNVDGVLYNATYTYTAPVNPQIPVQCPLKGETVSVAGYSGNSNTITIPENVNLPNMILIMSGNYQSLGEASKKIYSIASDAFTDEDDFDGKTIQMPFTTYDAPALADTWGNTFCSGVTVVFPESEDSKVKYYNAGWPENKVWLGTQQGMWVVGSSTINWLYDNNGTLTLSGSGAMPSGVISSESIPWYGFKSRIKHVVIGNGITSICNKAFYECTQLQDVAIPNSIISIESEAFKKCSSLTTVSIDGENSNLETIGAEAFSKCSALTSVVIPAKVTSIGALAYIACYNVTSITAYGSTPPVLSHATSQDAFATFDGQIVFLGSDPFNSSSTQTMSATVTMPSGKECRYKNAWGEITKNNESNTVCTLTFANAPEECPEEPEEPEEESGSCGTNLTWTYTNHVLTISGEGTTMTDYDYSYETSSSTSPWASHKDDITEVHFDAPNLGNIGNYAFYQFQNADFNEVTIPNSVVSIGNYAFRECNKLTAIHLGSAVRTIGSSAFSNCTALIEPICNDYMFVKMPTSYSGAYTIQVGTVEIKSSAFSGCTGLTSVTIPNSVTTMGTYVFQNCSTLTSAAFPSALTSIANYTYSGCTSLTSVTIPDNVTTIGSGAFSGCTSLSSVTLGASVNTIGNNAFQNCPLSSPLKTDTKFFAMPANYSGAYTIPEGIVEICGSAFSACTNLTSVTIPNSVTTIGMSAFRGCNNASFNEVTIPNSVISIGSNAFKNCSRLLSVTLPSGLTSIPASMFEGCTNLAQVHMRGIPPTSIGSYAFYNTNNVTFYVPKGTYYPYEELLFDASYSFPIVEENIYGDVTAINDEYSYWADFYDEEETVTTYKDAAYNALVASANANEFAENFTIVRPIQANGYLNTICLPFDLSEAQIANSDLAGAEIFAFDAQNTGAEIEMVLNEVTEMEAGMPYFFRYPNGAADAPNMTELNFHDVTVKTATSIAKTVEAGTFRLKGTLQNTLLNSATNYLFLGAEDALFYPDFGGTGVTNDDLTLRPFRAYFEATGGANLAPARIKFGRNTATDVEKVQEDNVQSTKVLENGQMFIIKNGVKYNLTGQVVK